MKQKVLIGIVLALSFISFKAESHKASTKNNALKSISFCGPNFYIDSYTSLRRIILQGPQGTESVDYPNNSYVFPGTYVIGEYKFYAITNLPTLHITIAVVDVSNGNIIATGGGTGVAQVTFNGFCASYKMVITAY